MAVAAGEILRGVDLTVHRGEIVGVVGESGSGKSTLGLAIVGLLGRGRKVTGGEVRWEGEVIVSRDHDRTAPLRGTRIGFIPQDPFTSFDPLRRVGPQVGRALQIHRGLERSEAREAMLQWLAALGVPDPEEAAHRFPHQLSGGMLQRAAIAATLCTEPDLVVADEPTTALDVLVRVQVAAAFIRLVHERGTALVIVTHDLGMLGRVADRVAAMYAGRTVEHGPTTVVLDEPRHPYLDALLASTVSMTGDAERLRVIAGQPPPLPGSFDPCAFAPRCPRADQLCREEVPRYPWPAPVGAACHHPLRGEP